MPDFQQFADTMKRALEYAAAEGETSLQTDEIEQAERHARLLQQI